MDKNTNTCNKACVKKIFVLALFCCLISPCMSPVRANDMEEGTTTFDYDFLDSAFSNPNPTTNKQFEDALKSYEKKKKSGLWYNIKKAFNPNNPMYDESLKTRYTSPSNQPNRIKDQPEAKPFLTIGFDFTDSTGKLLHAGHYQIDSAKTANGYAISLLQGNANIGTIFAKETQDDWETPAVIYSRVINVTPDVIKIIYSNLDLTLSGYIRAINEN